MSSRPKLVDDAASEPADSTIPMTASEARDVATLLGQRAAIEQAIQSHAQRACARLGLALGTIKSVDIERCEWRTTA